jgi:hypothetical protein
LIQSAYDEVTFQGQKAVYIQINHQCTDEKHNLFNSLKQSLDMLNIEDSDMDDRTAKQAADKCSFQIGMFFTAAGAKFPVQ